MLRLGRQGNKQRALTEALAASLDAMRSGSASLDDCLQHYPELADDLRPLLETSLRVQALSRVEPSEEVRLNARYAFTQAAANRAQRQPVQLRRPVRRRAWLALAPAGIAALLFALVSVPVLGSVDSGSVPGDWNYGFKRATERVRLAVTTDASDRRVLRLEFAQRRLGEIEQLSNQGHVENRRAGTVAGLARDLTSDVNFVNSDIQAHPSVDSSARQQVQDVAMQAQQVIGPIAQSAPESSPVGDAAQAALAATTNAANTVATVPPQTQARQQGTAQRSKPPTPVPATVTPSSTQGAKDQPTPAESATPAAASPTPSATPVVTPTPAATSTSAPPLSPTREAVVVPATVPTPTSSRTQAPTLPVVPDASPTQSPRSALPLAPSTNTEPSPVQVAPSPSDITPAAPAAVATRPAVVLPPAQQVVTLPIGDSSYRYEGPAASLDTIVSSLAGKVVVIYYTNSANKTGTWYPGTPAPVVASGTLLTIRLRAPGTLVTGH